VEKNERIFKHLQDVHRDWDIQDEWQLLCGYVQGISEHIPYWLDNSRISCAQLVIEESARIDPQWPSNWTQLQSRRYGDTCLHFLEQALTEAK